MHASPALCARFAPGKGCGLQPGWGRCLPCFDELAAPALHSDPLSASSRLFFRAPAIFEAGTCTASRSALNACPLFEGFGNFVCNLCHFETGTCPATAPLQSSP